MPLSAQLYREVQNQSYGYRPELVPPLPREAIDEAEAPEEGRIFLDRFGRRFKVYRARPYNPGVEGRETAWTGAQRDDVLTVPPAGREHPLEGLRRPEVGTMGEVEKARPYPGSENRYPYTTEPDLSRYPLPPAERDWRSEPLLRRSEPGLTPVPREEWPSAVRSPEPAVPDLPFPERRVPAVREEAPQNPWDKPALSREKPVAPSGSQVAVAPREETVAPVPQKQAVPEPPADPFAHLPFGKPVAGKKGFVTLEAHPSLPEIDVRGIAPGTPVEFPDPRDPGQIIQFRVPKFE